MPDWLRILLGVLGSSAVQFGLSYGTNGGDPTGAGIAAGVNAGSFLLGVLGFPQPGQRPASPIGPTSQSTRRNIGLPLLLAALAGLSATRALAGANILTNGQTCSQTPAAIGTSTGRAYLEVAIPDGETAKAKVGPMDLPAATWWELVPAGMSKIFGILVGGQYTAEKVIGCVSSSATPVNVQYDEEGNMPDRTSTGTATITPTVTDTPTPTATATRTATRTNTP